MRNRTMLLMCSLVYFPYAVVGVADAGPFPQGTTFPPPSIRLSIACTSEQTLHCLKVSPWECESIWPPPNQATLIKCESEHIQACRRRCGDDPKPATDPRSDTRKPSVD
jgi:hypothetical protein